MAIKVVSFHIGDDFREQTKLGRANAEEYCQRHGYEYKVYDTLPVENPEKPVAWYKLPVIREELAGNDWVFWLDTDTIITDHSRRLEEWTNTDKAFVFSADPVSKVNSGVFFSRNCDLAKQRLDEWFNGPMAKRGTWWEQWAIHQLIDLNEVEIAPLLSAIQRWGGTRLPRSVFFQRAKQWIFHAAGRHKFGYPIEDAMKFGASLVKR